MRTFIDSREMALVLAMETMDDHRRTAPTKPRRRVRRTWRARLEAAVPGHA